MIFSESNAKISMAYVKAWAKLKTPKHNRAVEVLTKTGGKYTFSYTDLGGILEVAQPHFAEFGMAIMQDVWTTSNEAGKSEIHVQTTFLHESGEFAKTNVLTFLAEFKMQEVGGQITYMKRYSLSAALGLSTEKDDDANPLGNMQDQNKNKPQNQNKNKPQNQNNQTPPGANAPDDAPPVEPKMISEGQKTKINILLAAIGKQEGKTKEEVLKLYKMKINKEFDVNSLKMQKASGLITELNKINDAPGSLYES